MSLLTEQQFDTLKEVVNIGIGRAASSLNEMLDAHIQLQVPSIYFFRLGETEDIPEHLKNQSLACVQMGFKGTFSGTAALVFPPDSAAKLVTALTGESVGAPCMNAVMAGTLNEVGNILLNGVMGTIGNILSKPFDYSFPNYLEGALSELLHTHEDSTSNGVLMIQTNFRVEELEIEGNVFLLFETKTFSTLIHELDALMHEV